MYSKHHPIPQISPSHHHHTSITRWPLYEHLLLFPPQFVRSFARGDAVITPRPHTLPPSISTPQHSLTAGILWQLLLLSGVWLSLACFPFPYLRCCVVHCRPLVRRSLAALAAAAARPLGTPSGASELCTGLQLWSAVQRTSCGHVYIQ